MKHFYFRPAFLPGIDEVELEEEEALVTSFSWLKTLHLRTPKPSLEGGAPSATSGGDVLQQAADAMALCPNLCEFTLILHDHFITAALRKFLTTFLRTMGKNLQKVTISTTIAKIPDILGSISASTSDGLNLASMDLTISDSRFKASQDGGAKIAATRAIVATVHRFKGTLNHLVLSSTNFDYDMSPLLKDLGFLPKLSKFEIWLFVADKTLSNNGDGLTTFLGSNAESIEHILIRPRPKVETFNPPQNRYTEWLTTGFSQLCLPRVHTLDLGLLINWGHTYYPDIQETQLPELTSILPNLRSLDVSALLLSTKGLKYVLEMAGPGLQELGCHIDTFGIEALDMLVQMEPNLLRLKLTYNSFNRLADVIGARRYPTWPLSYLRLRQRDWGCGYGHPDEFVSRIVKETVVSSNVEVDLYGECMCDGIHFKLPDSVFL